MVDDKVYEMVRIDVGDDKVHGLVTTLHHPFGETVLASHSNTDYSASFCNASANCFPRSMYPAVS